ncbi:MAG: DUF3696 domain-containing protein [bacterium]|nr:DUF3696 domain-containing protein [bacterium]
MLTSLELTAFKSFPKSTIPLKPLTLLAGLNNSGKSSVIQALRMFCKSAEHNDPLLTGHGSVEELRSKLSAANESIHITCHSETRDPLSLIIDEKKVSVPYSVPVCSYVGANRLGPMTSLPLYRSMDAFPQIGDQGEYVLDFLDRLENTQVPEKLHHDDSEGRTLEYEIRGWLSEIAPGIKFQYQTDSKRDSAHAEIDTFRPANAGFGISYILPVLAALLGMAVNSPDEYWGKAWETDRQERGILVMVENPEAHLHPRGQTAMGRLIALAAACGIQVIVETHSDHLMDGIRIAVKDSLLDAEKTVFHYFTRKGEEASIIDTPKLHSSGKLDYWPEGFFDQTLKNRARLARR